MSKLLDCTTVFIFKDDVSGLTHGSNKKVTTVCPMCKTERTSQYAGFIRAGHTYCKTCRQTINAYGYLIGTRVGKLTILGFTDFKVYDNRKMANFLASCECGNTTTILGQTVKRAVDENRNSSCGCDDAEKARVLGLSNVGENNGMFGKTGEQHPNYDPTLTDEYRKAKKNRTKDVRWQRTRKMVLKVYDNKCALCHANKKKLEVHHIEGFKNNEELRYDPNNCIPLCVSCHNLFHLWNGWNKQISSTKELFFEFVEGLGGKIIEGFRAEG